MSHNNTTLNMARACQYVYEWKLGHELLLAMAAFYLAAEHIPGSETAFERIRGYDWSQSVIVLKIEVALELDEGISPADAVVQAKRNGVPATQVSREQPPFQAVSKALQFFKIVEVSWVNADHYRRMITTADVCIQVQAQQALSMRGPVVRMTSCVTLLRQLDFSCISSLQMLFMSRSWYTRMT